jgi:hypothetical protein
MELNSNRGRRPRMRADPGICVHPADKLQVAQLRTQCVCDWVEAAGGGSNMCISECRGPIWSTRSGLLTAGFFAHQRSPEGEREPSS